jgi:hypothetical protein
VARIAGKLEVSDVWHLLLELARESGQGVCRCDADPRHPLPRLNTKKDRLGEAQRESVFNARDRAGPSKPFPHPFTQDGESRVLPMPTLRWKEAKLFKLCSCQSLSMGRGGGSRHHSSSISSLLHLLCRLSGSSFSDFRLSTTLVVFREERTSLKVLIGVDLSTRPRTYRVDIMSHQAVFDQKHITVPLTRLSPD